MLVGETEERPLEVAEGRLRPGLPWVLVGAALVVAGGVVLRIVALDADPTYPFWSGWTTDEGRWTEAARNWTLWRAPLVESALSRTHLALAPLFQAAAATSFAAFGVSSQSARLVSVLAGLAILLASAIALRPRLRREAWLGTVALVAVQPDLVYFSRVAIPEMSALLFELLAFFCLVGGPRTFRRAVFGGLLTAIALGFKGTTAPIVVVFSVVILCVRSPADPGRPLARLGGYLGAIVVPAVLFAALAVLGSGGASGLLGSDGGLAIVLRFVSVSDPYAIASTLYEGGLTHRVNLLLAAVWAMGAFQLFRPIPSSEAEALFVGALVWASGWILMWAVLDYFPERYVAHVHLPLVLAWGAGLSCLSTAEADDSLPTIESVDGWARFGLAAILAVPLAVLMAPAVAGAIAAFGPGTDHFRHRVLLIIALIAVVGTSLVGSWSRGRAVTVAVALPLAASSIWLLTTAAGVAPSTFWTVSGPGHLAVWLGVFSFSGLLIAVAFVMKAPARHRIVPWVSSFGAFLALFWLGSGVLRISERTHVGNEVVDYLTASFPSDTRIMSHEAASLFLDTPFRYGEMVDGVQGWVDPEVFVVMQGRDVQEFWLEIPGYSLRREFPLQMGRGYSDVRPGGEVIRVYEKVGSEDGRTP